MGVVTEEVATGLTVSQVKVVLQVAAPFGIVQLEAERVPDIASAPVVNVPSGEYPVPVELIA